MKKIITLLSFSILFSCQTNNDIVEKEKPIEAAKPITIPITEKVETDNMFAFDLFKTTYTNHENENVFISPLSVSMAFSMVLNGAVDDTKKEILETLRAQNYSVESINSYNKLLREVLLNIDPKSTINIANSIWYNNTFSVKTPFIDINKINYDATSTPLDFLSPDAVKTINNWCATQTNNKIPEIIKKISPEARMFLINAIYFKSGWVSKFDEKETKSKEFYPAKGQTIQVEMMHQTAQFNYTSDNNAQYIELPYGNNAFGMIVMLPKENKSINEVINGLNSELWNETINHLSGRMVNLQFPRFKLEQTYEMEKKILPQMGMKVPFTNEANFSGISDTKTLISQVIHKTYIEVNEEGSEAAAITNIGMDVTSSGEPSEEPLIIDYFVNKPFAFAIFEKSTGIILFMGKVGKIQ